MSLIKCVECGKDISDKAICCIGCGAPVQDSNYRNSFTQNDMLTNNNSQPKKNCHTNLLSRFINGDISLAKSFWLFSVLGSWLIGIGYSILFKPVPGTLSAKVFVYFVLGFGFLISLGVWRSAMKYKGWKGWGYLAIAAVLIPTLLWGVGLIQALLSK